jgi:predicted O-linked N-acetylglucosamine transferase (SPINDLY family)
LLNEAPAEAAFRHALQEYQAGRLPSAEQACRAIMAQRPEHAENLHLLGLITTQLGNPELGATLIRRAIALVPGQWVFHHDLALACRQQGHTESAIAEYRIAITLNPCAAELHNNFATTLREAGQTQEAIAHYRTATRLAPSIPDIWYNLATTTAGRSPAEEVEAAFRRALELRPHFSNAHANFGRWLITGGRWREADEQLADAIRQGADHAPVWNNRGIALQELGHADKAEACYRRALALDPTFANAHHNLGWLLLGQGRTDDAGACQRAAIEASPGYGTARLALCMTQLPILYQTETEIAERRRRYAAALDGLVAASATPPGTRMIADAIGSSQPFFLPYQGQNDRDLQAIYGHLACQVLARTEPPIPLPQRPAHGARIRVGIVSGFFCAHTIFKLFLEGWLTQLDRNRFEIIGFHTGSVSDQQTARAAEWCDRFVHGLPLNAWRGEIAAAAPHLLLYPEIGLDPVAGRLAAQRLAPVQCVAWGHPETTGMPTLDCFLSSALMEPPEADAHYTESLIRMPHLGLYYVPDEHPVPPLDRAALGLDPTVPVYWSGQALYKYLPPYDAIFPRIAAAVGPCQFVFIGFAKSAAVTDMFRARLWQAFAAAGLDAERHCVILPPMPQERFIAAVGLADVILDTPGWSGGKSTLDCLAQDPAIVTLPGRLMRGRHTAAILRRIGCEETIAASLDEYVAIAARLGQDAAWRRQVRQTVARGKARAYRDTEYMRALETFLADAVARA